MTATPPTLSDPAAWRPAARRAVLRASAAGLALCAAAIGVAWSWRDELPARVASHWSGDGAPDGFMSPAGFAAMAAVMAAVLCALFAAIGWGWGAAAATRRLAAAGCVWSGGFSAAILLTTLGPQRGPVDVTQVTMSGGSVVLALLVPLAPAVVAALLVPGDRALPAGGPVPPDAPRTDLAHDERAVWLRRATGTPAVAIGGGAVVLVAGIALVTQTWAMLVVPVLLAALLAAMFAFLVRVDATGLTVRSTLGWPRTHVPAEEILRASTVRVRPLAEFGGWGWRVARGGRVGVVLRSGEALLVERTGGRSFVVTVDDAATAAALLNTVADRAR